MDLTTNGVVKTDAIKFVQTNKEKLTSTKEIDNDKGSKEPDNDEDQDRLEEEREGKAGETRKVEEMKKTTNQVF